jgi:hypothetical protein
MMSVLRQVGSFAGVLVVLAASLDASAAGVAPNDFAYGMKFETPGSAAAYRATVPVDVYRSVTRADLTDVAVFNERNELVPHAIEATRTQATSREQPVALPIFPLRGNEEQALNVVRITLGADGATVNVRPETSETTSTPPDTIVAYVLDGRALTTPIAGLQIGWPEDAPTFAGRLRVEASDDLGVWRTWVDAAPVANLRAGDARLIERRIETRPLKSKFWRLSWVGERAPFEITSITAEPAGDRHEIGRPAFSVEGTAVPAKPGEFEFDLRGHFPVDRVNFELPELNSVVDVRLFSRATAKQPWREVLHSGFYRLQSNGPELVNGDVSVAPDSDRYWLARVDMRNNGLGSAHPKLKVAWAPHEVVFLARGRGPFTLAFGNAAALGFEGRVPELPKGARVLYARLGERQTLCGEACLSASKRVQVGKPAVLWGVLVVAVLFLVYMAVRLMRELKS